jgi:uncharacterized membrane protein
MPLFATFLLGIAAGLRSMAAPAAAVRAARSRKAALVSTSGSTSVSTSGSTKSAGKLDASTVFALLALAEMVADKLPFMPDRKSPSAFAWRVIIGGLSAAAATALDGWLPIAIIVGGAGAVAGTLGGSALRSRLARLFDRDFPAALLEDGLVLVLAALAARGLESGTSRAPALALPPPPSELGSEAV